MGETIWPRSRPSTAPAMRKSGTSEPTLAAISRRASFVRPSGWPGSRPSSFSRPRRVAAAFAEPAPRPPWTGKFFWMWMLTSAEKLSRASVSSTIFQAVLRASVGTPGWLVVRVMRVAGARRASTAHPERAPAARAALSAPGGAARPWPPASAAPERGAAVEPHAEPAGPWAAREVSGRA